MFNYDAPEAWPSENLWAWYSAQRNMMDAVDALESAGAGLFLLMATTDWQAEGVRALHELIIELRDRTSAEVAHVGSRLWETGILAAL
ncbi:MAG TPA: hypothetical protein DIW46_07710 [Microbacterium sp.]|uniref:hypothetical protein n=1 Tax=Microbacterium sp. TaxID=51671 RepID=UPI000EC274C3|nr:hypothetical protein [Microbacterium sp.]